MPRRLHYRIPHLFAGMLALLLGACRDSAPGPESPALRAADQTEGYKTVGEIRQGWVLGYDGEPIQITFEIHGGRAIFEGDIELGPAKNIPATREALLAQPPDQSPRIPQRGVVRSATACPACRWPNGIVYYQISPNLPNQQRVTDAVAQIHANNPGVHFIVRTTQPNYITVIPDDGCSSPIGRVGGQQLLRLADGCGTGSTIHEFLHALGFAHEQSRCDRDTFIEVHLENVMAGREFNFDKYCSGYVDVLEYAEGSIMHYGPFAFSSNGLATIVSKRDLDALMGQRDGMGTTDIQTLELMHPKPPVSVWVSGPPEIQTYQSAQYFANVSGGESPYHYQWRSRHCSGGTCGAWSPWTSIGGPYDRPDTYASTTNCNVAAIELAVLVTDVNLGTSSNFIRIGVRRNPACP